MRFLSYIFIIFLSCISSAKISKKYMQSDLNNFNSKYKTLEQLEKSCSKKLKFPSCKILDKICYDGNSEACLAVGIYWFKKDDFDTGLSYGKRSCKLGFKQACDLVIQFDEQNEQAKRLEKMSYEDEKTN